MFEFFQAHSYLIAQIFGFSAMALAILMYQFNNHKKIMVTMVFCSLLWCFHYLSLGLITPVALNAVNVLRNIIYSQRGKKWAQGKIIPTIFLVVTVLSVALTWENIWSVFPMIATLFATIANWITDTKKLRALTVPCSACWLTYNIINKSWAGTCNEIFVLSSLFIAIYRYDIRKKTKPAESK